MKTTSFMLMVCVGLMAATAPSRADTIILKNGVTLETSKYFLMAGAYYYDCGGKMLSIPEAEVARIEKAQGSAPVQAAVSEAAQQTAEEVIAQQDEARAEWQFIRDSRLAIEAQAKKTKSDFKATCAKALKMVERMYEGTDPNDSTFGYYTDVLNNPLMWEILPPDESAELKDVVFAEGGPYDAYLQPFNARMKEARTREAFRLADIANAQEAKIRQKEAYREWLAEQIKDEPVAPVVASGSSGSSNGSNGHCPGPTKQISKRSPKSLGTGHHRIAKGMYIKRVKKTKTPKAEAPPPPATRPTSGST